MSKYERVNGFTYLDCGLVNFTELWTRIVERCSVCTFGNTH